MTEPHKPVRVGSISVSIGDIALCVVAACVVWALIHGWG